MNINYRVVGLDPGGTTGAFQYDAEYVPSSEIKGRGELVDWKTTPLHFGPLDHHTELYDYLEDAHIQDFYLVYESFEYRNYKHRDNLVLVSKEYIGVAKLFAQQRGLVRSHRVIAMTAGQSKGFIPDKPKNGLAANAKLKAIPGFYHPGMKHANDAARVTANFLVNKQNRLDLIQGWRDL